MENMQPKGQVTQFTEAQNIYHNNEPKEELIPGPVFESIIKEPNNNDDNKNNNNDEKNVEKDILNVFKESKTLYIPKEEQQDKNKKEEPIDNKNQFVEMSIHKNLDKKEDNNIVDEKKEDNNILDEKKEEEKKEDINIVEEKKEEEKKEEIIEENKLVEISNEIKEINENPEIILNNKNGNFDKNDIKVLKIEGEETNFCTNLFSGLFKKLFG